MTTRIDCTADDLRPAILAALAASDPNREGGTYAVLICWAHDERGTFALLYGGTSISDVFDYTDEDWVLVTGNDGQHELVADDLQKQFDDHVAA